MDSHFNISSLSTLIVSLATIYLGTRHHSKFCDATAVNNKCYFIKNANIANQISDFWMYEESTLRVRTPSVLECAMKCAQDERCITFMFNKDSKVCRLHAAKITLHNTLQPMQGFLSYDVTCRESIIGAHCTSHNACTDVITNSECLGNVCQCNSGYSFSLRLKSCVTECQKYGTEFVAFKDEYIGNNNNLSTTDPADLCPGCCLDLCIKQTNFLCRTVEILSDRCTLSTLTKAVIPSSWYYHSNTQNYVTLYQRQCSFDD